MFNFCAAMVTTTLIQFLLNMVPTCTYFIIVANKRELQLEQNYDSHL